jgi:ABC-type multidrug transport system permease subunit
VLRELIAAVKKNILRLTRSKASAIAILLGPVILIIIVGLAFGNTKLQGIEVGTYVPEHTAPIDGILKNLNKSKETFIITEYPNNQSCVDSVGRGDSHICIAFLKDRKKEQVNVNFYVDYSRLSLVYVLLNAMNAQVSSEATNVSTATTRSLLNKVQAIDEYVTDNKETVENLSENSERMLQDLRQVKESIAALNFSNPADADELNDISDQADMQQKAIIDQQAQIDAQVKDAKTKVAKTNADLGTSKAGLQADQERLQQTVEKLRIVENAMNCTNVLDLTQYLENDTVLQNKLDTLTNPQCSIVYTARLNMEELLTQSEDMEQKITLGQKQLSDASAQLDTFQKESSTGSREAIQQIEEASVALNELNTQIALGNKQIADMRKLQVELVQKLGSAEASLEHSQVLLQGAKANINTMHDTLSNVTMITPDAIIKPFSTKIQSLTGKKKQFDFLFPSLITLIVMFVSVLVASTLVMKEKGSRAYFRNLIMPRASYTLFTGVLLTSILLTILQVAIIVLLASFFFGISVGNIGWLLFVLLFGALLFSTLGMIFGFIFSSEETTTLTAVVSCVLLFLFSSTLIPIESMSPGLASFARINPFVIIEILLRQVLVFSQGVNFASTFFWTLLAELLLLVAITWLTIRSAKKNF